MIVDTTVDGGVSSPVPPVADPLLGRLLDEADDPAGAVRHGYSSRAFHVPPAGKPMSYRVYRRPPKFATTITSSPAVTARYLP